MKKPLFFFISFFITAVIPALAAEVTYTGAAGRDPFALSVERRKAVEDIGAIEKSLRSLAVQGIVASASNPRAIINGKIYRIGNELLPGVRLTRIAKEGVYVTSGEKETLISRSIQPIKGKNTQ